MDWVKKWKFYDFQAREIFLDGRRVTLAAKSPESYLIRIFKGLQKILKEDLFMKNF